MEIEGSQHLSSFGPGRSGSHFAVMTEDGRLQLWDTVSGGLKREYKEQNHLSVQYTCLAWLAPPSPESDNSNNNNTRKKKKRKTNNNDNNNNNSDNNNNNNSQTLGKILLGTENGRIVIWDLTTGKLMYDLVAYEHKEVSHITTTVDGRYFYSVSKGMKLLKRWDVETGTSEKGMDINIGKNGGLIVDVDTDGDQIVTGTSSLQLWDQTSKQKIGTFPGHTGSITGLKFTPDNKYILSTAYNDRFPALWDCDDAKTDEEVANGLHSDETGNAQTFSMDAPPASCDVIRKSNGDSDNSMYDILAVSENGVLNLWRWNSNSYIRSKEKKSKKKKKKKKKKKRSSNVKATSKSADGKSVGSSVFAAMFCTNEKDSNKILIAHGDLTAPTFGKIQFVNKEDEIIEEILLESNKITDHTAANAAGSSNANRNTNRNGNDSGNGNSLKAHIASKGGDAIASWPKDASMNGSDMYENMEEDDNDEDDDVTLAQRVEALAKQLEEDDDDRNSDDEDDTKNNARSAAARAAEIASTVEDDSLIPSGSTPRARSLVKILEQALKSSDGALLEHCLGTTDKTIIRETVEGLSASCVVQFLTSVINKFEARPARAANLCVWIKTIVEKHAGYLTSSQDAVTALSGLHSTVDGRLGVFKRLLKLSGRLDLILSQISMLQTNRMAGNSGDKRPRKVFVDKNMEDEDDDEEEDSDEDDSDEDDSEDDE